MHVVMIPSAVVKFHFLKRIKIFKTIYGPENFNIKLRNSVKFRFVSRFLLELGNFQENDSGYAPLKELVYAHPVYKIVLIRYNNIRYNKI